MSDTTSVTLNVTVCPVCNAGHKVALCPHVSEVEFYESGAVKRIVRAQSHWHPQYPQYLGHRWWETTPAIPQWTYTEPATCQVQS